MAVVDIPCVMCGTPFTAKRASARYCGERCKKRAQRDPGRPAIGTSGTRPRSDAPAAVAQLRPMTGRVAELTERELMSAGRMDTALGAVALALASKLDEPGMDTGSSIAALAREHRSALAAAVDGAVKKSSPLASIKGRRDEQRAS